MAAWRTKNARGALWLLASAVLFTVMSVLVKILGENLHTFQISLFRMIVSLVVILPFLMRSGALLAGIRTRVPLVQFAHGTVASLALIFSFYAIVNLPLADAQAIGFSHILFVVPLAAFILREAVGFRRVAAALVGFGGVLVMLRPGGDFAFGLPAASALGHAFMVALASILVAIAGRHDKPVTLMFYTAIVSIAVSAPLAWVYWTTPTPAEWGLLVVMGVVGAGVQNTFIRAYAMGEASAIAPVDYTRLVFAGVAGYFLFASVPDAYTLTGAAIIVAATFYIIRREALMGVARARQAQTQ